MGVALLTAKAKATAIHLGLSLVIFGIALYLILQVWYPDLLFAIDGGWQGVRIMIGVDLVLGPLLTFIVFNPIKPRREITTDLGLIGVIQIAALCWGFWAVKHVSPLALSYHNGIVQSVIAEDLASQAASIADVRAFGKAPVLVYARQPATDEEKQGAISFELVEGVTPDKLVFLWEPLTENLDSVMFLNPEEIAAKYPEKAEALSRMPGRLLRFYGRYGNGVLAIGTNGEWLDSLILEKY